MNYRNLIIEAIKAKENSYAPYSKFRVGAALLCEDNLIITGCNVENSSYSATNCAERTAIFNAVSQGKRAFSAIAIFGDIEYCTPCGVCLQVMSEFCDRNFVIISVKNEDEYKIFCLKDLLPKEFKLL